MSVKRKPAKVGLRNQVLLLMLLVLLVPLGGLGAAYYTTLSSDIEQIERSHALEVSRSAIKLIDQLGEQLSSNVITNANWEDNRAAVARKDAAWVKENVDVSKGIIPGVDFVSTILLDGKVLSQAGDVKEFTEKVDMAPLFTGSKDRANGYGLVVTSKGLSVIAFSKITDEEKKQPFVGYLMFGRLLKDDAMASVGSLLNADVAIRSSEGQTLSSDPALAELFAVGESSAAAANSGERFRSESLNGKRSSIVSSSATLLGSGSVSLLVSMPAEASSTVHNKMIRLSLIAGILAIALIGFMAMLIRRRIVLPLIRFERFLGGVTEGRLTERLAGNDGGRGDEIGSIARSLQEMRGQLETLVAGIRSTAAVTADSANKLSEDAGMAAEGANRIAESMRELAAGAESQREGMKRGAEVTLEIRDGIRSIGDRTASVAAAAEQTTKHADEGNDTVRLAVEQMERIAGTVEFSVREARELHDKSEKIGGMADAIAGIAYRTNLLALNASIEASRAGEHGKGFAVVAGEVRKLALQANETADDITQRVEDVHAVIETVASRIEEGYREALSGKTLVQEAGGAFRDIASGIAEMEAELREIAAGGQEIGARVEELSALVGQTEAISEASADRSQGVADIAESQMAVVRSVAGAMESLVSRIRELEQAVNRFQ